MSKEDEYDKVKLEQFQANQRLESEEIYQLRQKKKQIVEDLQDGGIKNIKSKILDHVNKNFYNTHDLQIEFRKHPAYSKLEIKNFLPLDVLRAMAEELNNLPVEKAKKFDRRGSCMYEFNDLTETPIQEQVVNAMHSSPFLTWLQEVTDTKDLIPDPHLIGAGYAKNFTGDSLKIHTDFNWNEQLRLHRRLSLVIYLNETWNKEWGGNLDFYDLDRKNILSTVVPGPGNLVLWSYHNLAYHGYPEPMTNPIDESRKCFRLFYYVSNSKYHEKFPPHRSLYWFDENENTPYDKPWIN